MLILALDASTTAVGHCVWNTSTSTAVSDEMVIRGELNQRLALVCQLVRELIQRYQPDEIYIEQPFVGPSGQTTMSLGKLWGAIWMMCHGYGYDFQDVTPAQAKLAATGRGNAAKKLVQQMITAQIGRPVGEHEADAVAVALAAEGMVQVRRLEAL